MKLINFFDRTIASCFYLLFFFVPLIFAGNTSELFEFNKMWLTFGLTIIIVLTWISKMVIKRQFFLQRTPLDIPIILFLLSQVIATVFSMDRYVSFWGYYSRFNGGLLSTISYILLYYAFVSNTYIPDKKSKISFLARSILCATGGIIIFLDVYLASLPDYSQQYTGWIPIGFIIAFFCFNFAIDGGTVKKILSMSLLSGLIVGLWGLPAHFGYDPTCYVFRGHLDVSCWTNAFQPKVRIFSTLGQPDWMAAYLALLIPISIALCMKKFQTVTQKKKAKDIFLTLYYFSLTLLFYVDLLFTRARSGYAGLLGALLFMFAALGFQSAKTTWQKIGILLFPLVSYGCFMLLLWKDKPIFNTGFILTFICFVVFFLFIAIKNKHTFLHDYKIPLVVLAVIFVVFNFFIGTSISQIDKFTLANIQQMMTKPQAIPTTTKAQQAAAPISELGGTDSGQIRLFVWEGALKIWQHYPLFGTGVETFAFAYYKFRPAAHNMTSEWDYLYNKAHNEYLNYLATTGIFGLGTYLAFIGLFFFIAYRKFPQYKADHYKPEQVQAAKALIQWDKLIITGVIAGFISMLISNFFGFSVVIINLYLFIIPAFVLLRERILKPEAMIAVPKTQTQHTKITTTPWQYVVIILSTFIAVVMLVILIRYWQADVSYAEGFNLDQAGYFQQANSSLEAAVEEKPQEAVFSDELAVNDAVLATNLASKDATQAGQLAHQAVILSNQTVSDHPNNVVYWKTRVRIFYSLAQLDQRFLPAALEAIQKAHELAPTDAKIAYNLGLLYSQTGDIPKGMEFMKTTIDLKPDYRDAYYALGLFYRQEAIDKNGNVVNKEMEQNAVTEMHIILTKFDPKDKDALKSLSDWKEQ